METGVGKYGVGTGLYDNAIDLIECNDISGAADFLRQALELESENALYLNALGLCLYIKGRFEEAGTCWLKAASPDGGNSSAEEYLKSMDTPVFRKYVNIFNLCIDCAEKGRYVKALAALLPAIEEIPNTKGYNLAGLLCCRLGMGKTALRLWKRALCLDLSDECAVRYISGCSEGIIPLAVEKMLLEVFLFAGRFKLL